MVCPDLVVAVDGESARPDASKIFDTEVAPCRANRSASVDRIDLAKASGPIEKMLCSTAELKKADDDMSAAYFKLLRETKDPDFHAALIRSQHAAVLTTGQNTYDRYVRQYGTECDFPEVPMSAYVKTSDGPCPLYRCDEPAVNFPN